MNDINKLKVDAIVNDTDNSPLGNESVDGIINCDINPNILEHTRKLGVKNIAGVKIITSFSLTSKYIIHLIRPTFKDMKSNEVEELYQYELQEIQCLQDPLADATKNFKN